MQNPPCRAARRSGGFTLIELLVAIGLMALMTVLSWRGVDGISRSQHGLQQRADDVQALQATLAQWGVDLDAIESQPNMPGLDWDGRALRILRRSSSESGEGLLVVAWALRSIEGQGRWLRWQSPLLRTRGELELAWQKAAQWAQTPGEDDRLREVRTVALDQWQIFYYRSNAWSNPLSSAGSAETTVTATPAVAPASASATPADTAASAPVTATTAPAAAVPVAASAAPADVPDGVRLVLTLSAGQAISGTLTRDWVRPVVGGGK